jgi:hypothetical protein
VMPATLTPNLQTIVSVDDATSNERYTIRCGSSNGIIGWVVVDGGVTQAGTSQGTPSALATHRFAGTYALNDFAGCLDGSTVSTDTAGTLPAVTRMIIGSRQSGEYVNGYIRRIKAWKSRRSNADLQEMTIQSL